MFTGGVNWMTGRAAPQALASHLESGAEDPRIPPLPRTLAEGLASCFTPDPAARPPDLERLADALRETWREATGGTYPRPSPREAQRTAESLNNRAVSYLDLGRDDDADRLWQEALRVHPHQPEATYNRGLRRWRAARLGDLELVEECRAALERHPGSGTARLLLALVHLERDDPEAALEALEGIDSPDVPLREVEACRAAARERRPHASGLVRTFDKDAKSVSSVDLSADGRWALSDGGDGTLDLWDVATGRCVRTLEGHRFQGFGTAVRMSPDARLAVSGGSDAAIKAWDLTTGRCLRVFDARPGSPEEGDVVAALDLSEDGRYAVTGHGGFLSLWDVRTGSRLKRFETDGNVEAVCFARDGRHVLAGGGYGQVALWDLASGRRQLVLENTHTRGPTSIDLAPDGRLALTGGDDLPSEAEGRPGPAVRLWDLATGRCLRTFAGHVGPDSVRSVRFSPDGRHVVSGGDWSIKLWDLATGRCLRTLVGHRERVTAVRFSADGRLLVSGSFDGTVRAWRFGLLDRPEAPPTLCRVSAAGVLLSAQGRYERALAAAREALASGDAAGAARQVRGARSQPGYRRGAEAVEAWTRLYRRLPRRVPCTAWTEATLEGHPAPVMSVDLAPDGRRALSGDKDGTVRLWDLSSRACVAVLEAHRGWVTRVQFCAGGRAVSRGADGTLKLWDLADARCVRALETPRGGLASSADAEGRLAVCDSRSDVELWDLESGRRLRMLEGHRANHVMSLHLSPDARYALSGGQDRTVRLWDLASGRCLRTLEGHEHDVWSVALTADLGGAMSASVDGTIKVWRVATGECVRTVDVRRMTGASFGADGRHVFTGGDDDTLGVWDALTGECLARITHRGAGGAAPRALCMGGDGKHVLWGNQDGSIGLGLLDWELEEREPEDWDEAARPWLESFLACRTPPLGRLPEDGEPTEDELRRGLTRRGAPAWGEDDFASLLDTLGCAGFGWLRPEGVRRELERMARSWTGPAPIG